MIMTAEPTRKIDEGKHTGTLIKCEESIRGGFKYMDLWFKIIGDGVERTIKAGVPSRIEQNSTLGAIIKSTGRGIIVGETYDLEQVLVNKKFQFLVREERGKDGKNYMTIIPDTIKAVE